MIKKVHRSARRRWRIRKLSHRDAATAFRLVLYGDEYGEDRVRDRRSLMRLLARRASRPHRRTQARPGSGSSGRRGADTGSDRSPVGSSTSLRSPSTQSSPPTLSRRSPTRSRTDGTQRKGQDQEDLHGRTDVSGDGRHVEAIVSVFGNVDLQGDRVIPGAFRKSIAKWRASGAPVPFLWAHLWSEPWAHIGWIDSQDMKEVRATEVAAGTPARLYVKATLDVERNETARYIAALMKERRVREFSFGYDVLDERKARDGANDLLALDIIEASVTLKGANPETLLVSSKTIKDLYERTRPRDATPEEIDALAKATDPAPATPSTTSTLTGAALASHLVAAHGAVLAVELLATNEEGLQRRHYVLHA